MTEIWQDPFQGIIPRNNYSVQLSDGEESGLVVTLKSEHTTVTIFFGVVRAHQMVDEGVLLHGPDSEQFAALRAENFPSTIYEIENGDFGCYIRAQMGQDLYDFLDCREYSIVTRNYLISVITTHPPEITVSYA